MTRPGPSCTGLLRREYGISRQEQDEYALRSHRRAVAAQKNGRKMAVVGTTQRIMALFEMTKVDSLLKLYPTVEDAEKAS